MSDWHFGIDYDMWLYPPVDWTSPDYNYELPEPIEAANIEGTLLVNAEDAIEQVRRLQAENDKLRKAMDFQALELGCMTDNRDYLHLENAKLRKLVLHTVECVRRLSDTSENGGCVPCPYQSIDYDCDFENRARELGVGVDDGTE